MRYILDDLGYIEAVSCTYIECSNKSCTEYTGAIPEGYESLDDWVLNANIRAYKIEDGNLVYNEFRATELEAEWEKCTRTNIVTARLTSNYTIKSANTYEILPLTEWINIGNKLTVNSSGEIVIGAGVKYIKIRANGRINNSTGQKYLAIQNSSSQQLVQGIAYKPSATGSLLISLNDAIFKVEEGERISLRAYGTASDIWAGASQEYGMLVTYLTVEVIE